MQPAKRQFRPGLWPSAVVALLLPLLIALGFWQLDRAGQKQALEQTYQARQASTPIDLLTAAGKFAREEMLWRRVRMHGEYLEDKQYLLDNQVKGGKPGYLIFSPFRLADRQTVVLINRGWLPAASERKILPEIPPSPDNGVIEGTVKDPQSNGLFLGGKLTEKLEEGLIRVQRLDLDAVARDNDWRLLPYVVRLDKQTGSGLVRDWKAPGFGRERHLGYAFQWFALAAALSIIYLVVNVKPVTEYE